ncbi:MAG: DNA/RNA non-specific endonuclease [Tannerellaceae bacterium]|nr:DNA/RNA non-specific endonuclease [Tannerellaceae bacterium]
MAKKRTTTRTRKKKRNAKATTPFFRTVKQLLIGAILFFVSIILILFLLDYLQIVSGEKKRPVKEKRSVPEIDLPTSEQPSGSSQTTTFHLPANAEIPKLRSKRKEQVIQHEGFNFSYNSDYRIANWVAYELTEKEAKSKEVERTNKFIPDPLVKGATATNEDYVRSGYDKGHLAPAGDMKWSAKAMRESFYFSNICPQAPGLNRGIWKTLEDQARLWAIHNNAVFIVTGPVIEENLEKLGKNKVGIPNTFYKVICTVVDDKPTGVGFLFENREYKKTSLKSMAIPIDSVEKVTGIDFFYSFPEEWQKEMESKVEWKYWSF